MLDKVSMMVAAGIATAAHAASADARTAGPQLAQVQAVQPGPAGRSAAQRQPSPTTRAEFTKRLDARFAEIDSNKDGQITSEEIAADRSRVLQRAVDAEQKRLEERFKRLDTNGDGQVSLDEFKALARPVRPDRAPDQMIARIDTDKDGRISAQEYRAAALANFDRADADNDGILVPEELPARR